MYKLFPIFLLFTLVINSQSKDPETILNNVKTEFEKVEDYQVDVQIKVDVSFLKMPDRKAVIFYKKPDKFQIESENFAMLPKSGLNFSPLGFLNYNYTAFYEREDTIDGILTAVVKVIPLEASAEVILSTLWVDTNRDVIMKVESSRKPQGTFTIDIKYLKTSEGFWLPTSLVFEFTVDGTGLPKRFNEYQSSKSEATEKEKSGPETGKVFLTYSNYKVNRDLSDEIFEKKENNK
jgi:outer membrane lipoprotein-sorting protein